jgi:hypothetical protein
MKAAHSTVVVPNIVRTTRHATETKKKPLRTLETRLETSSVMHDTYAKVDVQSAGENGHSVLLVVPYVVKVPGKV